MKSGENQDVIAVINVCLLIHAVRVGVRVRVRVRIRIRVRVRIRIRIRVRVRVRVRIRICLTFFNSLLLLLYFPS
jgi:hypothetical protein